ncbi:unnamed protein product [Calypogeia fissa]
MASILIAVESDGAESTVEHQDRIEFDDVESAIRKPLLGQSKSTASRAEQNGNGAKSASTYLSAPKQGAQTPDNITPPYKVVTDCSTLFKAMIAVGVYFTFGTLCFYFAKDDLFGIKTESFIDALYFCVVTLTTVGYGDLVPDTTLGKLFTSLYIFIGFGLVGAIVSGGANYIVEMQEKLLIHSIKRKMILDYEIAEEQDYENAFWKVIVSGMMVVTLFIVGIIFMIRVEEMTLVDAIYCVCVTMTTLGYGDHSFETALGRLFAAIWILTGTVFVGQFFLYLAEMRTVQRQLKLAHWVLHRKTTPTDLREADLDGDGLVNCTEFVVFKLKELGKIDDVDVAGIIEEFHQLDYDRSGTISLEDLKKSQGE